MFWGLPARKCGSLESKNSQTALPEGPLNLDQNRLSQSFEQDSRAGGPGMEKLVMDILILYPRWPNSLANLV